MSHGGKRKGAGRKPRSVPLKAVTVRIPAEYAERFDAQRRAAGCSQSAMLRLYIDEHTITTNITT